MGRYALLGEIGAGGMATVHLARLLGPVGFSRTVAIKRLRAAYLEQESFVSMLIDEARLGARIRHPNVVATLDVVMETGELLIVLDYVHGESLGRLLAECGERSSPVSVPIAVAIVIDALRGLQAAHETKDESGVSVELIHRDISPQNVLVGVDGVARIADFGVAHAKGRLQETESGVLKGKAAYMAPEQAHDRATQRSDIFSLSAVAWEILEDRRLFGGQSQAERLASAMLAKVPPLSRADVPPELEAIIRRGLARDANQRWPTALDMARAMEAVVQPGSPSEVGAWVRSLVADVLAERERLLTGTGSGRELFPTGELLASASGVGGDPSPMPKVGRHTKALWRLGAASALAVVAAFAITRRTPLADPTAPSTTVIGGSPSLAFDARTSDEAPAKLTASADSGAVAVPTPALPQATSTPGTRAKPAARRDPTTTSNDACNPPYVIDANGHKKFKRECFGH